MTSAQRPPDGHVVSVVIPTIGRATLARCLTALRHQTRPPDEVIVVTDEERRGPAWARNEGIRRSRGDLLAFTDDDCEVPPEWLEQLVRAIDQFDAAGAGGTFTEADPFLQQLRQRSLRRHGRTVPTAPQVDEAGVVGGCGNIMYRRSWLEACARQDGYIFNQAFRISQDWELVWRLRGRGARLAVIPATVHHLRRVRPLGYLHLQFGRGVGIGMLYRALRNGRTAAPGHRSLLWGGPEASHPPKWLAALWGKVAGPFDRSSFTRRRDFWLCWLGEKCQGAGFIWGLFIRQQTPIQRICVWGTSLQKVADEAQMMAACEAICARVPQGRITVFARPNGSFARQYPDVEVFPTAQLGRALRRLAQSRLFVVVGGPFLEHAGQAAVCWLLIGAAKLLRRPVVTYGTTILEYRTRWGRWVYRRLFERLDAIAVREQTGLTLLRELGVGKDVAVCADPRLLLEPAGGDEIRQILSREGLNAGQPLIGLTTRYLHEQVPQWVKRTAGYSTDSVVNANAVLARTVTALSRFARVVLIPMHPSYDQDVKAADAIRRSMPDPTQLVILSRSYRPRELMGIIGACELLMAGRLGSAIFATVAATPIVGIAYESRLPAYMAQIGCERYVRDWRLLDGDFVELAEEVWACRAAIRQQLRTRRQALRQRAHANGEVLSRFCNGWC